MNVLVFLIPVALGAGLLGLAAFLWSVRSGQYDDLDGDAMRILLDDEDDIPGSALTRVNGNAAPKADKMPNVD